MHISDIMIHIDNEIKPEDHQALEDNMRSIDGVIAPRFNKGADRLLLVAFNPALTSTANLLQRVREAGFQAQLVGV